uniref:Uncharacterized protein n=1 Tax=Globisporangium ultimum (strain ATCC 200006 / CBS 805.95 / DAOM BR144) TaxID=431595 RepID=K3WUE0_GLOUD
MGNLLSVVSSPSRSSPAATSSAKAGNSADDSSVHAPLFLNDIKAEPAAWSQEGMCLTIQRFFGMLPDSAASVKAETLKQEQRNPQFHRRPSSFGLDVSLRADAIVVVQRVFRRYRVLTKWHDVASQILELARSRIETRQALENEEMTLASFRTLLADGFSAHKVSITGALKNIQLQLVKTPDECYLAWSPSCKRQPRIQLHDVEQVVPVLRTGNKHTPRLANKVSHRRGLIIVCKSHHRGRIVLELGSKRERNLLLCGFQRLLGDMNRVDPTLDEEGAIRKRLPRRQSVIDFFDPLSSDEAAPPTSTKPPLQKHKSANFEQLYQTRFDEPEQQPQSPVNKATLVRRSSMVASVK